MILAVIIIVLLLLAVLFFGATVEYAERRYKAAENNLWEAQKLIQRMSGELELAINNERKYQDENDRLREGVPVPKREDINQVIRNHFSTVLQQPDLMIAIVSAGNGAAEQLHNILTGKEKIPTWGENHP